MVIRYELRVDSTHIIAQGDVVTEFGSEQHIHITSYDLAQMLKKEPQSVDLLFRLVDRRRSK